MRKLVYGALALSAALAVGFGTGAKDAKAEGGAIANTAITEIETSGDDTLTITAKAGTKKILVGIPSFKSNVKNGTSTDSTKQTFAVSAWDVYEGASAEIDLSKIAKTKDAYLVVKTDFQEDKDAVAIRIPASLSISASYDKKVGTIKITKSNAAKDQLGSGTGLNYYTDSHSQGTIILDGTEATIDGDKLLKYQMSGATLYVETNAIESKATAITPVDWEVSNKKIVNSTASTAPQMKVYNFNARCSKPAKLSITKLANAPKPTANYVKGTITLPKGTTARVVSANSTYNVSRDAVVYATTSTGAGTLTVAGGWSDWADLKANINATEKFAIDIYTTAKDSQALQSRTGRYVFAAQPVTDLSKLEYSVSYASGKYTGLVKSNDAAHKYTIYYKDANGNDKKVTLGMQTTTTNGSKPGTARLTNISQFSPIHATQDGNAKTGEWIGTSVECESWEACQRDDSNVIKYVVDVVINNKNEDKADDNVKAAHEEILNALYEKKMVDEKEVADTTRPKKTYKMYDEVELTLDKTKIEKVTLSVDNAMGTPTITEAASGKVTFKFMVKSDKNTKITVSRGKFSVTAEAKTESDATDSDVKIALATIKGNIFGKTFMPGETIKDLVKGVDTNKVVVEIPDGGNIKLDGNNYELINAAAGKITVTKKTESTSSTTP